MGAIGVIVGGWLEKSHILGIGLLSFFVVTFFLADLEQARVNPTIPFWGHWHLSVTLVGAVPIWWIDWIWCHLDERQRKRQERKRFEDFLAGRRVEP